MIDKPTNVETVRKTEELDDWNHLCMICCNYGVVEVVLRDNTLHATYKAPIKELRRVDISDAPPIESPIQWLWRTDGCNFLSNHPPEEQGDVWVFGKMGLSFTVLDSKVLAEIYGISNMREFPYCYKIKNGEALLMRLVDINFIDKRSKP